MKLFKKVKLNTGKRIIYLGPFKIFSYKKPMKNSSSVIISPSPHTQIRGCLQDNKINIPKAGDYLIHVTGTANEIYISKAMEGSKIRCAIYGSHNKVFIDSDKYLSINLIIGTPDCETKECSFSLGKGTQVNGLDCKILEEGSCVTVGEDCLLSDEIEFWASDTHTILNDKNEIINKGKQIEIGNHVWIGKGAILLKNTAVADGNIVGMRSIVTKKFEKKHIVIAGNPAKVVKENVFWNDKRPNEYEKTLSNK